MPHCDQIKDNEISNYKTNISKVYFNRIKCNRYKKRWRYIAYVEGYFETYVYATYDTQESNEFS